jgi:hypothetical protein
MSAPVTFRATKGEAVQPLPSRAFAPALILGGLLLISP